MGYDVFAAGEEFEAFVNRLGQAAGTAEQQATDADTARAAAVVAQEGAEGARDDAQGYRQEASESATEAGQSAIAAGSSAAAAATTLGTLGTNVATATTTFATQVGLATTARQDAQGFAQTASEAAAEAGQSALDAEAKRAATQALVNSVAGLRAPWRTLFVDFNFRDSTDGFTFGDDDVAVAITQAIATVATEGGRVLLVLRHDDAGDPITIPTPHTRDSLAAQGVDVEIAGESADGAAARFAAHIIGWWLGYHPLSSDVLAETGYSVNLNRLPFPITQDGTVRPVRYGDLDGIPTTFAPIEHRHDFSDLDALPQMLTVEIDADGGAPPAPGLPHGTIKADPDDATRAVWFVHGSGVTRGVYDLRRPLYGDLDGIPATFAPSAHVHWQRVWYSDFLAANRSGKLVTTSGYECTATGASASGGTSGHLVNTGTPVQRLVLTVSVGTTNGMFAGAYLPSTAASTVNGARMHIVRSGGAWLFSGITYVAGVGGSPTPVNTTLTGTPSDGSTWTLVMETDGTGSVAVTVTPLGGVPQSFTVTVPSATVGGFSGQLNAGTGGLVLTQACFIKTPSA